MNIACLSKSVRYASKAKNVLKQEEWCHATEGWNEMRTKAAVSVLVMYRSRIRAVAEEQPE